MDILKIKLCSLPLQITNEEDVKVTKKLLNNTLKSKNKILISKI